MKWPAPAVLLAAAACHSGGHDSDVVAVEVKSPVQARLMLREHEEAASCTGTNGVVERLSCIFQTTMTTCAYVELESPELAAVPFGKDLAACQGLSSWGPRVLVAGAGTDYRLEADPAGGRIAYSRGGSSATVAYLIDGVAVGVDSTDWPVDWNTLSPLDDLIAAFYSAAGPDTPTGNRLLAYAQSRGGERAVVELMNRLTESSIDRWAGLYEHLEDEALKREALSGLHAHLRGDDAAQLVSDLIAYPELQPRDFTALVATAAERWVRDNGDWYTLSPLLDELQRRKHPAAAELACRIYGMQLLSSMPSAGYSEYDEVADPDAQAGALAIIAREKAPCRWVGIALQNDPCAVEHRCLPDGGLPDPEAEDLLYDEDTGAPIITARPLCSRAVALSAVRRGIAAEDDEELEDLPLQGPLLLAAGYAHDAIPKELFARNARRLYRFDFPPPPPPTAERADAGETNDPPCQRPRDLSGAVCHLPLDVTEVTFNGCRLRIDDKARVVRVEELKP